MDSSAISSALRPLLKKIRDFEGEYPYMYMDTTGNVTVGVGHNLTAHYAHLRTTSFTVRRLERHKVAGGDKGIAIASADRLNRPATAEEVLNDYNFLKAHIGLGKYPAANLEKYTTLELSAGESNRIFEEDCEKFARVCRTEFGAVFNAFPVSCQVALIDIAFNRGSFMGFRHEFSPAIKGVGVYKNRPMSERWKIAAENSSRRIDLHRDATIKQWLLQGAAECESSERQAS